MHFLGHRIGGGRLCNLGRRAPPAAIRIQGWQGLHAAIECPRWSIRGPHLDNLWAMSPPRLAQQAARNRVRLAPVVQARAHARRAGTAAPAKGRFDVPRSDVHRPVVDSGLAGSRRPAKCRHGRGGGIKGFVPGPSGRRHGRCQQPSCWPSFHQGHLWDPASTSMFTVYFLFHFPASFRAAARRAGSPANRGGCVRADMICRRLLRFRAVSSS